MAIVKRIAQAHGGFVVASNHEAGGQVKVWLANDTIMPDKLREA